MRKFFVIVVIFIHLSGCAVLYIPPLPFLTDIEEDFLQTIEVGKTTRQQILENLGEPNVLGEEKFYVYRGLEHSGTAVVAVGYEGGWGPVNPRAYRILIKFDEDDLVTKYQVEKSNVNRSFFSRSNWGLVPTSKGPPLSHKKSLLSEGPFDLWSASFHSGAVAASPDGSMVAGFDNKDRNRIFLWDLKGLKPTTILQGTSQLFRWALEFFPDGMRLATAGIDGLVIIWDVISQEEILRFQAYDPTGYFLGARLYYSSFGSLAISPNGDRLATGGEDGLVKIWEADTGREILVLKGHTDKVISLAFSPDGTRLASADSDNVVRIWSLETGNELTQREYVGDKGPGVAFSQKVNLFAVNTGVHVEVWGIQQEKWRTAQMVKGSSEAWEVFLELKNVFVLPEIHPTHNFQPTRDYIEMGLNAVDFSADGKVLGATNWAFLIWDLASSRELGRPLRPHIWPDWYEVTVYDFAFNSDAKTVVTAGKGVHLWEIKQLEESNNYH